MVSKKSKRNIKNRRKTKRKQKGGSLVNVMRFANKDDVQMFNLLEEQPYSKSKEYRENVAKQNGIMPYYSSFSTKDFLPVLEGEENDLIDLISGKLPDLEVKSKNIFVHSTKDKQLIALNKVLSTNLDINTKIKALATKLETNPKITTILDIIKEYQEGKIYIEPSTTSLKSNLFDAIKNNFDKYKKQDKRISTDIYSNGLLEEIYILIDDDIISTITSTITSEKSKYNLILSDKNIRYLVTNIMLNQYKKP
jgi:hypothetical protein